MEIKSIKFRVFNY